MTHRTRTDCSTGGDVVGLVQSGGQGAGILRLSGGGCRPVC